jgi:RNase P subunit RPR2
MVKIIDKPVHRIVTDGKKQRITSMTKCGLCWHNVEVNITNHWSLVTCKNCLKVLAKYKDAINVKMESKETVKNLLLGINN